MLISKKVFAKKNIDFFPANPVSDKATVLIVSTTLFLFLVTTIIGEFEELLRIGSDDFFKGQFIFGWSTNMKRYFLGALLVAPIFEELFTRGILLQSFLKKYSTVVSIILTTLIFVSFHLGKDDFEKWDFIVVDKISIALYCIFVSWVMVKTSNIKLAVFLHFFWNLLGYVFPLVISVTRLDLTNPASFFIFSIIILLGSSIMLTRSILRLRSEDFK